MVDDWDVFLTIYSVFYYVCVYKHWVVETVREIFAPLNTESQRLAEN